MMTAVSSVVRLELVIDPIRTRLVTTLPLSMTRLTLVNCGSGSPPDG